MNHYLARQRSQGTGLGISDSLPLIYWSNLWQGICLPLFLAKKRNKKALLAMAEYLQEYHQELPVKVP